mgnify:CR=1 FL=1
MLTTKEILDQLDAEIMELEKAVEVTICTYEDLLIRVSENRNKYMHVFIVYDLRQGTLGEWSQDLALSLVICDKMKADKTNKLAIHSNSQSLGIEIVKKLRTWGARNGYEGINAVPVDFWTEDESDSLLAGIKLELTLTGEIGGYCDIIETT